MNSRTPSTPDGQSTSTPPAESLLVRFVRAHVRQGDKARERADQGRDKAEQHFIAAGQYLAVLKANYTSNWSEWETLLKTKVGLSASASCISNRP